MKKFHMLDTYEKTFTGGLSF